MKETFILSDINERELLRSLAFHNKGTFNVHVFDSEHLAKEALLRNGVVIKEKQISTITQTCIIYNSLSSVDYFKEANFEDARNIVNAINYARQLCRGDEEQKINDVFSDGEFKEKNNAILDVYNKYISFIKEKGYIDSIGIINYCINNKCNIDGEFIILNETPLEPLSEELLKTVSKNSYKEETIIEFAGLTKKSLNNIEYASGYGAINEVEHIIDTIAMNKLSYEDCAIALVDNSYINHFLAIKDTYNVPMSFGTGYDISAFNSYKILILLDRWNKGYNSINVFKNLLYAPEFDTKKFFENVNLIDLNERDKDRVICAVGNLRISIEKDDRLISYKNTLHDKKEINNYPIVESIANELYKGYVYLIKTYTISDSELESKAINKICSTIEECSSNLNNINLEDVIGLLKNTKIARELSREQAIHITDLKGALSIARQNIFVCGLNAKSFPGSPIEDYLLLDSDLDRFNEVKVKNSNKIIQINKELLNNILNNSSAFDSKIYLSYSGYNLSELKDENPSSLLFEIFKSERGNDASIDDLNKAIGEQYKYFDQNFCAIKNIGSNYLQGIKINEEEKKSDEFGKVTLDKTISPSTADIFFSCPKRFYLTQILGIIEPQEDNPFDALPANDLGTLIHECMEDYGNNKTWTKEEFLRNAKEKLDNYFKKRIPVHNKDIDSIERSYLEMAETGYNTNPNPPLEIVASEKYLGPFVDIATGIKFGGIVDRIEKLPNGKYQIVDYKTYKDIKNKEDDVDSCFQVCLYAYMMELDGKEVEGCEYRYLRLSKQIKCVYNEAIKQQLHVKLGQIKTALDTGVFPCTQNEDNCIYCKLGNICGKDNTCENKEEETDGQ